MQEKILRNQIRCKLCGEVIESIHVHDFKMCSCGACGVDGGHDYLRRLYKSADCYEELSVVERTENT